MLKNNYTIKIMVIDSEGEVVVCSGLLFGFESAKEELCKLERFTEKVEKDKFMEIDC